MPTAILIWIWFCAYLNCVGWTLSALHQLNAAGYVVALLLGAVALAVWWKPASGRIVPHISWRKLKHRFRRPFPLAFLILTAMAGLGGVLYAPSNYDALAYRLPRVLNWLAAGQWHWIHAIFPRVNTRACGIEWVSAPFIALLKTDRLLFLINLISFLLLPGLVFSVFTRLGVRRRVAWHWMWIVPTGYCFLLQAASIGNDLFGAVFVLAAVDFALRTEQSRDPRDFWASILAAAMMTNSKLGNLPLLLPWAVAFWPSLALIKRWPLRTVAICVFALMTSLLPISILNAHYCGDWTGLTTEGDGMEKNLPVQIGGNIVLITSQNLAPPVFPLANQWNHAVERALPTKLSYQLDQTMETPGGRFPLPEMQMEEGAGLGFGVSVLLLVSVLAVGFRWQKNPPMPRHQAPGSIWQTSVRWSPAVSLFVLMTQSNLLAAGRLLTPYYALLVPMLLVGGGHERLLTRRWWRASAFAVFLIAAGLLVVSPPRPLFPVGMFLEKVHTAAAQHPALKRMETVYSVYRDRSDGFAPARAALPPDVKVLGLITYDDPETSLWRPFGSRRIDHICPGDTAADLKQRGIEYVLVREEFLRSGFNCSLDDWLKQMNAQVVQKIPLNLRASKGALDWYLVQLR